MPAPANAIRIKTPSGWRDLAVQGPTGPRGAQGDPGPTGDPGPAGPSFLDVQRIVGNSSAYKAITNGQRLTINANGVPDLALSYTPPVNAWWEVTLLLGLLQKTDAAYHYATCYLALGTPDVDGLSSFTSYKTQHSAVQQYEPHVITAVWKLAAGVPYQSFASLSMSGGTWQYNQGAQQLAMHAKAWAR